MKMSNTIGELKVIYKTTAVPAERITNSFQTAELLRRIWDTDLIEYLEQSCLICLSRSNRVIAYQFLSTGGTAGCLIDPKVVFQAALLANASSVIISHNHPSGNLQPSEADRRLTTRLFRIGKDLDMPVLDHVIMTKDNYHSMADAGELGC